MGRSIIKRYRRLSSNIQAVIIGVVCGLVFFAIYLCKDAVDVSSFEQTTITPEKVYFVDTQRNDRVVVECQGIKYEISYSLWKGLFERDDLVATLRRAESIKLWVQSLDTKFVKVRGVKAEGVFIDPELGVKMDNSNRNALLWTMVLFFGLGGAAGIYEMILRWRARTRPK